MTFERLLSVYSNIRSEWLFSSLCPACKCSFYKWYVYTHILTHIVPRDTLNMLCNSQKIKNAWECCPPASDVGCVAEVRSRSWSGSVILKYCNVMQFTTPIHIYKWNVFICFIFNLYWMDTGSEKWISIFVMIF